MLQFQKNYFRFLEFGLFYNPRKNIWRELKAPVKASRAEQEQQCEEIVKYVSKLQLVVFLQTGKGDSDHRGPQGAAGHQHAAEGRLLWGKSTYKVKIH